jgi:hypothetical protein
VSDFEDLDYYELFGVSRSASQEEIKRAYRQEISKYHPDRFANAAPEAREYASRRSQRITEAYSVLSDFTARTAYNRGQAVSRRSTPARRPPPVQPRDHQAELYEQAQDHFAAGRLMQTIAVLRQLQQLNPFYRDSAELLAAAEERMRMQQRRGGGGLARRLLVFGGLVGGVALAALAAWLIGMRGDTISATGSQRAATAFVALAATELPTQPPEPTTAPSQPTTAPIQPTDVPAQPTAAPVPPTDTPTPPLATPVPPTDTPAQPPTAGPVVEQGPRLFTDTFAGTGWAEIGGNGWRVGYQRDRYRITVEPGIGAIWSYRTSPARDVSIGVDVQVASGEGGLLLGFLDANNYLSFSTNPQQTSFRVEQHRAGSVTVLTGGQSEAIHIGAEQPNRLVARLRGDHLNLLINGQPLADLDVPGGLASSRYGLVAISSDTAAEAFFDNLEIRALE